MNKTLEKQLIEVVAWHRIDKPISSISGKIKRMKPKLASAVDLSESNGLYEGDRVWARVEYNDEHKARGTKEGIEMFEANFPKYGRILKGYIEEQRALRETHLYFGVRDNCRLTSEDYLAVMQDLGFTRLTSDRLYPELMDMSRRLAKKRDESGTGNILIG